MLSDKTKNSSFKINSNSKENKEELQSKLKEDKFILLTPEKFKDDKNIVKVYVLRKKRKLERDIGFEIKKEKSRHERASEKKYQIKVEKENLKRINDIEPNSNKNLITNNEVISETYKPDKKIKSGFEVCLEFDNDKDLIFESTNLFYIYQLKENLGLIPEINELIKAGNKENKGFFFEFISEVQNDPKFSQIEGENILCNHWIKMCWIKEKRNYFCSWEPVFRLDFLSILHLKSFALISENEIANNALSEVLEYLYKKNPQLKEDLEVMLEKLGKAKIKYGTKTSKISKRDIQRKNSKLQLSTCRDNIREPRNSLIYLINKHYHIKLSTHNVINNLPLKEQINLIDEVTKGKMIKTKSGQGILIEIVEEINDNCILVFSSIFKPLLNITYIYRGFKSKMRDGVSSLYKNHLVYYSIYILKIK